MATALSSTRTSTPTPTARAGSSSAAPTATATPPFAPYALPTTATGTFPRRLTQPAISWCAGRAKRNSGNWVSRRSLNRRRVSRATGTRWQSSSGNRSPAVRNQPPLRGWQRAHRARAGPPGVAPSRHGSMLSPPLSLMLATWADDYVAGLTDTRYLGEPTSEVARAGINRWVAFFAGACHRAVADASGSRNGSVDFSKTNVNGRATRARVRQRGCSSARCPRPRCLRWTPQPKSPAVHSRRPTWPLTAWSTPGVLVRVNVGRRNRAFEAPELSDAFTALERRMASPLGDTLVSGPTRDATRRRGV